ncbi:hypothetical protein D3C72_1898760 [compost metagenome]
MQHDAGFHRLGDRAVILPAHVGQHLAAVLIDVQGGVVARIVGEQGYGVDAALAGRRRDAVTRGNLALSGDLDHLLQADAILRHDHAVMLAALVHGTVIVALRRRLRIG